MSCLVETHSLSDEEFFVVSLFALDTLLDLDHLQLASLLKQLPLRLVALRVQLLSLVDGMHQLSGFLELSPQLLQLLSHLGISTSRLTRLSDFSPSETDVRVRVVCFLACLDLQKRHQRPVAFLEAQTLPVWIDMICPFAGFHAYGVIVRPFQILKGQDRWVVNYGKWLSRLTCFFEKAHYFLKEVFCTFAFSILVGVSIGLHFTLVER